MNAKQGTFALSTAAAGNTQAVTGLGFTPTVVLFWLTRTTTNGDAGANQDCGFGFGVAISASSRRCMFIAYDDGEGGGGASHGKTMRNDSCIAVMSDDVTLDGLMDLQSMDSGGFTLVIDDAFSSAWIVHYLAMDPANASLITFNEKITSTGQVGYTGAGFQPEAILLFGCNATLAAGLNAVTAASRFIMGVGTDSTHQGVVSAGHNAPVSNFITPAYGYDGEIYARVTASDPSPGVIGTRAALVSLNSDGFTLDWTEVTTNESYIFALCLAGPSFFVDDFTSATDTNQFSRTGYGFKPAACLYLGHGQVKSTQDTAQVPYQYSVGGASGVSARAAVGISVQEGVTPLNIAYWQQIDELWGVYDYTPAAIGLMDLVSFDADGQTLVMDDADASAKFVLALAFGPAGAPNNVENII